MKKPQARLQNLAGLFLFSAGSIVFMGITSAETLYPSIYQTASNAISDLGTAGQISGFRYQPAAAIFNLSMIVTGILILLATYCLMQSSVHKVLTVPLTLFGIGVLGVGIFPGNLKIHALFALFAFVFGAISAIASARVVKGLFKYPAVLLGVIALCSLIFYGFVSNYLGIGGAERWIAYPNTLWMIGFGGYLMSSK